MDNIFSPPNGVSPLKWKFLWNKRYFELGYGSFFGTILKVLIALFGVSSQEVVATMALGVAYVFACWLFGFIWVRYQFAGAENEVNNRLNSFTKEMRTLKENYEKNTANIENGK